MRHSRFLILGGMGVLAAGRASAVIVADDPGRNTSAPTGALADSGWQYEGEFGSFAGTAIAPNYFITASHIGGSVGQAFTYNGRSYSTTAMFDDPGSDLRIWKVDGDLGPYAPVVTSAVDAGQQVVINGRGTQRGEAIVSSGGQVAGWQWGEADGAMSWGVNMVDGTAEGGAGIGTLLRATFDGDSTLSSGDSGGGVFAYDGGTWKLAGVNYGVESDGIVNGQTVSGALLGQSLYASSIPAHQAWIASVLGGTAPTQGVPEPASTGLIVMGLTGVMGLRRRRR